VTLARAKTSRARDDQRTLGGDGGCVTGDYGEAQESNQMCRPLNRFLR